MSTVNDVADDAIAQLAKLYPTPGTFSDWSWLPKSDWTCRDAARVYAMHGFEPVLVHSFWRTTRSRKHPICTCGDEACTRIGKHPRRKGWRTWPTDPASAYRWYGYSGLENSNVGFKTGGESRLFVLDVDPKNGGFESLARLEAEHGPLPATLTAKTPSGGKHLYFSVPDGLILPRNSESKIAPGIDVRCDGGLVVVPPSRTPVGQYEWVIP